MKRRIYYEKNTENNTQDHLEYLGRIRSAVYTDGLVLYGSAAEFVYSGPDTNRERYAEMVEGGES